MTDPETLATYAAETDAFLAAAGPPAGPMSLAELVDDRAGVPDARLAGPPADVAVAAEVCLPLTAGPTTIRVYRGRSTVVPAPLLLWLHGGGFVGGSLADVDVACRLIAASTAVTVVSLDYRLAPEHPFPAALHDTCDAVSWLSEHGAALGGDGQVFAGGQSAGANLVLASCLAARDRAPMPAHLVLCYPALDDRHGTESWQRFDGTLTDRATHAWELGLYLAGRPVTELSAPLRATSFAGLPSALVIAAGRDPYRDDARRVVQRIQTDGGRARLIEYPDTPHAFLNFPGALTAAKHAVSEIAADLEHVASTPVQ